MYVDDFFLFFVLLFRLVPVQLADVWSCGVTLYVMLVGAYPFEDQEDPRNFRKTINVNMFSPIILVDDRFMKRHSFWLFIFLCRELWLFNTRFQTMFTYLKTVDICCLAFLWQIHLRCAHAMLLNVASEFYLSNFSFKRTLFTNLWRPIRCMISLEVCCSTISLPPLYRVFLVIC